MNNKKKQLTKKIIEYANNNEIDLAEFRHQNPSDYSRIAYYFGSINNMLKELEITRVQSNNNKMVLRDQLAFDMLTILRKHYTLAEIANNYNVTKSLINQLYQNLEFKVKSEKLRGAINERGSNIQSN